MSRIPPFIDEKLADVQMLCRRFDVIELGLFGSVLTERFDPKRSDLDFLVEFQHPDSPGISLRFLGLAEELEKIFGRPVDLITKPSIRNPIFSSQLQSTVQRLYAA